MGVGELKTQKKLVDFQRGSTIELFFFLRRSFLFFSAASLTKRRPSDWPLASRPLTAFHLAHPRPGSIYLPFRRAHQPHEPQVRTCHLGGRTAPAQLRALTHLVASSRAHHHHTTTHDGPPQRRSDTKHTHASALPRIEASRLPPTMPTAGLKTIIALSFVLAVGFLLVILSCALFNSYFPLLVVATYVLAPVPNWICSRCANPDDFVESSGGAVLDLGRFCTGFFVVMGMGTHFVPLSPPHPSPPSSSEIGLPALYACVRSLTLVPSPSRRPRPRRHYPHRSHDHVHPRRPAHLRNHNQLWHVFPGGAGVLEAGDHLKSPANTPPCPIGGPLYFLNIAWEPSFTSMS